jgi:AraC-like DNA-binding protein
MGHAAVARTSADRFDPWRETASGAVQIGDGPVAANILRADYSHDDVASTQVLGLLPPVLLIRGRNDGGLLEDTVRLLGRELAKPRMATGVVLDRLVDILLVQVLRAWLAAGPASAPAGSDHPPSWLGALGDELAGAAMARMHEDPARPWTTATLARSAGVSRATLTRRFTAVTGESPGAYLTRWRMDLAARQLRDTDDSLAVVARSVGYTSVYAFSRAFSRLRSEPPGRYRARSRRLALIV